jgi:hypothetical protein
MSIEEEIIRNIRLNHPKDVKRLIAKQINKIRKSDLDIETESRLIAQLSNRLLDSMKMADIEKELEEIRKVLKDKGIKGV